MVQILASAALAALLAAAVSAQNEPAPARPPVQASAEELLARLSLEQKCGQLFMSWILARAPEANRAQMRRWIAEVGLGGVIVSLGTVDDAVALVTELQDAAELPLLLAGDFEGGVAFRLQGAVEMGNQMLVGATGDRGLARLMGEVTGAEARALGFHWCFAPVLDVNVNPGNPIINVRSFGGDAGQVAAMGAALAAGVRSMGVLPCGKHFPGHGDVATDSHLSLPTVPGDRARLDAVELLPFRVAAAAGLESVMTGHLAVPGLGEEPGVPATRSPKILGEVLRRELGFTGLIVSDALDMGGVKGALPPGEVAVRALQAGVDVLLMPPDPYAARDAVLAAVRDGRVSQERLDDAVLRILRMKERVGLVGPQADGSRRRPDPAWREVLALPHHQGIATVIAEEGLTLVRDDHGVVPLPAAAAPLLVTLLDQAGEAPGRAFAEGLRPDGGEAPQELRLHGGSGAEAVAAAAAAVAAAPVVVIGMHVKVRSYSGQIGLPPVLQPVLAALRPGAAQTAVVVSFGNPYLGRGLPAGTAYLCAYASTAAVERAAVRALRGASPLTGRVPVALPDVAPLGHGLSRYPGTEVGRTDSASQALPADLPARVTALLEQAVADHAFPGAVCLVARRGQIVVEAAVGRRTYEPDSPAVTLQDRFDLASLTKVCATTAAILKLVGQGRLSLDDPVQKWVPAFQGTGKERVTVRHLLAHGSGLPAYERYYRTLSGKAAITAAAAGEGLMTEPGDRVLYSDLGFILLQAVVEACAGEGLDAFVAREVWAPLGMTGATFAPTDGAPLDAVPTEVDPARGGALQGRVHDENAFAMGGVSGHAGLFARGEDVLRLGLCLLGGGRGVLPAPLVDQARRPAGVVADDQGRGLGLELPRAGGWAGSTVPPGLFGHTGFTGTSLWCDPGSDLCVVLLSNRVHPTRVNARITGARRALHDLLQAAVAEGR